MKKNGYVIASEPIEKGKRMPEVSIDEIYGLSLTDVFDMQSDIEAKLEEFEFNCPIPKDAIAAVFRLSNFRVDYSKEYEYYEMSAELLKFVVYDKKTKEFTACHVTHGAPPSGSCPYRGFGR